MILMHAIIIQQIGVGLIRPTGFPDLPSPLLFTFDRPIYLDIGLVWSERSRWSDALPYANQANLIYYYVQQCTWLVVR